MQRKGRRARNRSVWCAPLPDGPTDLLPSFPPSSRLVGWLGRDRDRGTTRAHRAHIAAPPRIACGAESRLTAGWTVPTITCCVTSDYIQSLSKAFLCCNCLSIVLHRSSKELFPAHKGTPPTRPGGISSNWVYLIGLAMQ